MDAKIAGVFGFAAVCGVAAGYAVSRVKVPRAGFYGLLTAGVVFFAVGNASRSVIVQAVATDPETLEWVQEQGRPLQPLRGAIVGGLRAP